MRELPAVLLPVSLIRLGMDQLYREFSPFWAFLLKVLVASSVVSHERSDTWFAGAGSDATATRLGVRASVPGEGARKDPFTELGT